MEEAAGINAETMQQQSGTRPHGTAAWRRARQQRHRRAARELEIVADSPQARRDRLQIVADSARAATVAGQGAL
jgi:hypothetical protein